MEIDRIYRDEIDNHYSRKGWDIDYYYNSELVQVTIQPSIPRGFVSGLLEYFTNGYSRQEFLRNLYNKPLVRNIMVQIAQIRTGFTKVNCEGEILDVGEVRTVNLKAGGTSRVADAILKDPSGTIALTLWDHNINMVKKGSKVVITNAFAKDFKGKLSLSTGRFGKMDVVQY